MQSGPSCFCCVSLPLNLCAAPWRTLCPRCRALICWAAGGTRWMYGCCCSPARRCWAPGAFTAARPKALDARLTKFDAVVLAICIAASAAFYLHAMVGRQSLYLWDNATYYNLQIRLESNFADGVFTGVGSTIYKTWFNDYAPLVINLLAEPFFMFTPRTANTFALLCGLLVPTLVYYSAWVLLAVLRRQCRPKAPRLFTALGLAMTTLLPLLHIALYRGMPDLLGVAFALMLLALGIGYDFSAPAPARLVSMAAFTGLLMLTRRSYMFTVAAFFVLYGVWVLARAALQKQGTAALRFVKFAVTSLICVGVPLVPMFWRIVKADYSDRYATYQTGGFLAELDHQRVYLGYFIGILFVIGILYALYKKQTRFLTVLSAAGSVLTVFLVTKVQEHGRPPITGGGAVLPAGAVHAGSAGGEPARQMAALRPGRAGQRGVRYQLCGMQPADAYQAARRVVQRPVFHHR